MRRRLVPIAGCLLLALAAPGQPPPRQMLVTVAEPISEPLTAVEFDVRVDKRPAEVLRVYQPQERGVRLAVLIDDSAGRAVQGSLSDLTRFLRGLPRGSEVMLAYARRGQLITAQAFTAELEAAARALRAPSGLPGAAPTDLGVLLNQLLSLFPEEPRRRAQVLYLGQGTPQDGASFDLQLDRAIRRAQERGVPVFAIHVPPRAPAQGPAARSAAPAPSPVERAEEGAYLERLARETGGRAFSLGRRPLTLETYLSAYRRLLDRQYLVEWLPPTEKPEGKVTVEIRRQERALLHPTR